MFVLNDLAKEGRLKREVGLWIDHTKAIIVTILGENDETRCISSNIKKYVRFSGGTYASPLYGICDISGKGKHDREFKSFLKTYYEGILSLIRYADSIWIFGPGAAKGELAHFLQHDLPIGVIVDVESKGKMTDRQIVAEVRQHYQGD